MRRRSDLTDVDGSEGNCAALKRNCSAGPPLSFAITDAEGSRQRRAGRE